MKLFVGAKALVHYKGKILLVRESDNYEEGAQSGKWDVVESSLLKRLETGWCEK